MRRVITQGRWLLLSGVVAASAAGALAATNTAPGAASKAPTAQALMAEYDADVVQHIVEWTEREMLLPGSMALDPALRASVSESTQALSRRLRTMVPTWIAEERAAQRDPALRGSALTQALLLRSVNELLIGFVESTGPAHDEAWLQAALAPTACQTHESLFYARRIAIVQAAPAEVRPALLAAEQALLARWGTTRSDLPPRPANADLLAGAQAAAQLREGLPVTAAPMTPFLARMVFARDRRPDAPDRRERCAISQWWLQTQLAAPGTDRAKALQVFRYSLLPDVEELLPEQVKADTRGDSSYPRAARHFGVQGSTTVRARVDAQGQVQRAEVVARNIRVPGIRDHRPLAFEALLDGAALAKMRERRFSAQPEQEVRLEFVWKLEGDERGAR